MTMSRKWIGAFVLTATGAMIAGPALAQSSAESGTGQSTVGREGQSSSSSGTGSASRAGGTSGAGSAAGRSSAGQSSAGSSAAAGSHNLDQKIAVCLLLGNQEEVALAQFAQQRSQNDQVRQFAEQMIEHHQQAISQIQQAAPETAALNLQLQGGQGEGGASGAASGQSSTQGSTSRSGAGGTAGANSTSASGTAGSTASSGAGRNSGTSATAGSSGAGGTTGGAGASSGQDQQAIQLAHQIKQECLNLTQQQLAEKQGADFDKGYMAQQVAAHVSMLAELRGSKNFAGSQLQEIISQGEQMTQQHLDQAKQIVMQLDGQQGGQGQTPQTSQRPGATQRSAR